MRKALVFRYGFESFGYSLNKKIARFFASSAIWFCVMSVEIRDKPGEFIDRRGDSWALDSLTKWRDWYGDREVSARRDREDIIKRRTMRR